MRRLNFKLLLGLVIGVVSLAAGVHVVHGLQSTRSANALLQQAGRAEKKGERAKAARYLDRYLSYAPNDAETQTRFGKLLLPDEPRSAPDNARTAVRAFERALSLEPGRDDLRRQVAAVLIKLGTVDDYAAALTHLDVLAASADRDRDGELAYQRGECLEAIGRYDEAARAYEKARRDNPRRVAAYARLATLLRVRLNRTTDAERVMDAVTVKDGVVAANARSAEAYVARARYRKQFNPLGNVERSARAFAEDAARALELAPDDAEAILVAAEAALGKGKGGRDEARALLERGAKAYPRDVRMYLGLAQVESASRRPAGVVAAYERAAKVFPDSIDMMYRLADAQITCDKLSDATALLKRLADASADRMSPAARAQLEPLLRYEDARILMARRKWSEAAAAMERAVVDLKPLAGGAELVKSAYLLLGRCYAMLNNPDKQFSAFLQASSITLADGEFDVAARQGLAEAFAARHKYDEAAAEYRRILTRPSAPPEVRVGLARVYILRDIELPAARRRWADAEQALAEAESALPGSPEVAVLRGAFLQATGKPDEAARTVRAAREKAPDRVDLWTAEADLAFRAGKADESLRLLDEAASRLGPLLVLRQARAVVLARRGGPKAVESIAAIEASAADLGGEERRQLLASVADAYALAGEPARSHRLTRRLADEDPTNLPLRLYLFDQAQADGDEAAADLLLAEIEKLDTEKSQALLAKALLLIRRAGKAKGGSLGDARRLLSAASRLRPNWARVSLAEARIDELQGRQESALANYLRAFEQGDRSPSAVLRAFQLLTERGRDNQANQVLQLLENRTAMNGNQQMMAAELALRSRDYDMALAQARGAVAADRKAFRNVLFLGRVLYVMAKQDESNGRNPEARLAEAEQSLRRAVELAADDPTARVALVSFLAVTGRKPEALELTRSAGKAARSGVELVALAKCYESLGDAAEESDAYKRALAAGPDDPVVLENVAYSYLRSNRMKDAEAVLRRLAAMAEKAPRGAAYARRTLAFIVASSGDPKRVAEALALLAPGDDAGGTQEQKADKTADRRARVKILVAQPEPAQRREAIGILTGMVKGSEATAADRLLLARLYDADGDWPRARETFQALMDSDGENPNYVAVYALTLVEHKAFQDAEAWTKRLERALPDSPAATEVRARLLYAQGRKAQALALVDTFVKGKDDQALPFANLLETLGETGAAEATLRRAVARPGKPPERYALITFLARHGKLREALDLCDAAWADLPAADVSYVTMKVLMEARTRDPADLERVGSRLEQAVKTNPALTSLLFDLANLRTYQGKCDEAEAIYRNYLAKNPKVSAPLNNIAWLLAVQKGKGAEALATIERAIKADGDVPALLDTRAMAYLSLGRSAEAIKDLKLAVARKPTADLYFHLAQAYQMAGETGEAGKALRKARELGLTPTEIHPLERPAYERLAAVLAKS